MAEKIIGLSGDKGEPEVEIVIGFAQFGKYRFSLSTPNGEEFRAIFEGDNADSRPDKFVVPWPVEELDNRVLRWKVIIAAFETGPGELYSVIVRVRQDGANVPDSPFKASGPLDGVKVLEDEARFRVL